MIWNDDYKLSLTVLTANKGSGKSMADRATSVHWTDGMGAFVGNEFVAL